MPRKAPRSPTITSWVNPNGDHIAFDPGEENTNANWKDNAKFIVRAVSSYDLLLSTLKLFLTGYEAYPGYNIEIARKAIAEAERKYD